VFQTVRVGDARVRRGIDVVMFGQLVKEGGPSGVATCPVEIDQAISGTSLHQLDVELTVSEG
jgi:hypothetical protein